MVEDKQRKKIKDRQKSKWKTNKKTEIGSG